MKKLTNYFQLKSVIPIKSIISLEDTYVKHKSSLPNDHLSTHNKYTANLLLLIQVSLNENLVRSRPVHK